MLAVEVWAPREAAANSGGGDRSLRSRFRLLYNGEALALPGCAAAPSAGQPPPPCPLPVLLSALGAFAMPKEDWLAGPCQLKPPPPATPLPTFGAEAGGLGSLGLGGGGGDGVAWAVCVSAAMASAAAVAAALVRAGVPAKQPWGATWRRGSGNAAMGGGEVEMRGAPHLA